MNPFAKTVAGLFTVVGPKSNTPLEAERICSALIQKLLQDPSRNLDPRTWQNAVQMIPTQVGSAITSQTLSRTMPLSDLPGALASICLDGASGGRSLADLAKPIAYYLSTYGEPTAFNFLLLDQTNASNIHLSLTCLNVTDGPDLGNFSITSTLVAASLNLSNKLTQSIITKVFGSFGPPDEQPFYLRIFV
ncbi:glutamate acetyltransferase [Rhizobium sp. L9]|uniref:glutamate acetyltransferase n=1 Tax=Rhizobium sp. L9 TaxID=1340738 RepID=UPI000BE9B06D|nr:glutamate acetyltransferase [Rhizobium sp. L9]PDT27972.1 glutamate acetyltransferase [Rhizobium sp. L9]